MNPTDGALQLLRTLTGCELLEVGVRSLAINGVLVAGEPIPESLGEGVGCVALFGGPIQFVFIVYDTETTGGALDLESWTVPDDALQQLFRDFEETE